MSIDMLHWLKAYLSNDPIGNAKDPCQEKVVEVGRRCPEPDKHGGKQLHRKGSVRKLFLKVSR